MEIKQNVRGYWEIWIDGSLHCTTDSYTEAQNELREALGDV